MSKVNLVLHFMWMNCDQDTSLSWSLQGKTMSLVWPLYTKCNKDNEINKKKFIKQVGWWKDYRTWKKYWTELIKIGIIVQLDKDTWMVNPHERWHKDVSQATLIRKWENAHAAN